MKYIDLKKQLDNLTAKQLDMEIIVLKGDDANRYNIKLTGVFNYFDTEEVDIAIEVIPEE